MRKVIITVLIGISAALPVFATDTTIADWCSQRMPTGGVAKIVTDGTDATLTINKLAVDSQTISGGIVASDLTATDDLIVVDDATVTGKLTVVESILVPDILASDDVVVVDDLTVTGDVVAASCAISGASTVASKPVLVTGANASAGQLLQYGMVVGNGATIYTQAFPVVYAAVPAVFLQDITAAGITNMVPVVASNQFTVVILDGVTNFNWMAIGAR